MSETLKEIHDTLLAEMPEGAVHDPLTCAHCTTTASEQEEEMTVEQKTSLTQEQHEQLLASAVEKATNEATASVDG